MSEANQEGRRKMARTVAEAIVKDDGKLQTIEKSYSRGKGQDPAREVRQFQRPTLSYFQDFILTLSDKAEEGEESELARIHRLVITAMDREVASDVYERAAGTSTIVRIGKVQYDLMALGVKAFVKGYNGTAARRDSLMDAAGVDEEDKGDSENDIVKAVERNVGWNPWRNAFAKRSGKGEVRLDEASGMVVPA